MCRSAMSRDMNPRIGQVTLVVKNQAEALEFYTKKVGFEKKTDVTPPGSYRWVTVGPSGHDLEVALWQMGSPDPNGYSKNWRPGGPPMIIRVDDCRKTFAEMKSRGVKFDQDEPYVAPWGAISCSFTDPDGNRFGIQQAPTKLTSS